MAKQKVVKMDKISVEKDEGTNRVLTVRPVQLAFVSYLDNRGQKQAGLALVGQEQVRLINMRRLGLSLMDTQEGGVNEWFRDQVFEGLKEK